MITNIHAQKLIKMMLQKAINMQAQNYYVTHCLCVINKKDNISYGHEHFFAKPLSKIEKVLINEPRE